MTLHELLSRLDSPWQVTAAGVAAVLACAVVVVAAVLAVGWARRTARAVIDAASGWSVGQVLITVGVAAAGTVAVLGGVRSFEAVSDRFTDPLVPLTADGMIVACTALRLAALSRGWRLPGSLVTTYGFIAGTVILNAAAAHDAADVIAHALAPIAFAVLQEMLAHLLRLHLRLSQPSRPKLTALTWLTSPVVSTRVWLHLARTGTDDPAAARALVQQVIRMGSRLTAICPSGRWRFDAARSARLAALETIRDGLVSAAELAAILPADADRLEPGALLALVDGAALRCTAPAPVHRTDPAPVSAPAPALPTRTGAPAPDQDRTAPDTPGSTAPLSESMPNPELARAGRDERTDAALVAMLHAHAEDHNGGAALSQREVMRVLGCGTPKAKRLTDLAWPAGGGPSDAVAAGAGAVAAAGRADQRQLHVVTGETHPDERDDETETSPENADNQAQDDELEARSTR